MTCFLSYWLCVFFIYSFAGWLWESSFVSIQQKEWINRGFLSGPVLPIYGIGAILILFLTKPVEKSLPLIFLVGMTGASALELTTGMVMERLFHVRYWDYSGHRFQLKGHICLSASLLWGVFSVVLVKLLHPHMDALVRLIPTGTADALSLCCTIIFAIDAAKSVQSAVDFKRLLVKTKENAEAVLSAETGLIKIMESLSSISEKARQQFEHIKAELQRELPPQKIHGKAGRKSWKEGLREGLQKHRDSRSHLLKLLNRMAETTLDELKSQLQRAEHSAEKDRLAHMIENTVYFQNQLKQIEFELTVKKNRRYEAVIALLQRNPGATAPGYEDGTPAGVKQLLKKLEELRK